MENNKLTAAENNKSSLLKSGDVLQIIGRRWFDKINGNTYHAVQVILNHNVVYTSPMTYGYDDHYIQTAANWLRENGYINLGDKYTPLWKVEEMIGFKLITSVRDGLKRDLKF